MTKTKIDLFGSWTKDYLEKTSENGGTRIDLEVQTLELYPAGYTKNNNEGISRQKVHQSLFDSAVLSKTHEDLYPFDGVSHSIKLILEPNNMFDRWATKVVFRSNNSIFQQIDGQDLGYIPKKISEQIAKNLNMFNEGRILKVRENYHNKYYTTKVIFGFDNHSFDHKLKMARFNGLLDDD